MGGGKVNDACEISTWTTGGGIAIGTNVDLYGYFIGAAATTLTLKVGTDTLLVASAQMAVTFDTPVAITGALNGTSSGGSFAVMFRRRNR